MRDLIYWAKTNLIPTGSALCKDSEIADLLRLNCRTARVALRF